MSAESKPPVGLQRKTLPLTRKHPEPLPKKDQVVIEQFQLSDEAELITSATVEFSVGGFKRYVKTELKEIALPGEDFDDFSYRSIDAIRTHVLRTVQEIAAADINSATRRNT